MYNTVALLALVVVFLIAGYVYSSLPKFNEDAAWALVICFIISLFVMLTAMGLQDDPWKLECIKSHGTISSKILQVGSINKVHENCEWSKE